jgi:hypothetical protein
MATRAEEGQNERMGRQLRSWLIISAGGLVLGMAACGGGSGGSTDGSVVTPGPREDASETTTSAAPDAGDDLFDPDADIFIPCANDVRAEHYVAGMQKTALNGQTIVRLLSSDPGPPIKGNNVWQVLVTDAANAPQPGTTLKVNPFMPDHGHGSPAKTVVKPLSEPAQYTVAPLYLFMAGLWEITFNVTAQSGVQDAVVFRFCIEQ